MKVRFKLKESQLSDRIVVIQLEKKVEGIISALLKS